MVLERDVETQIDIQLKNLEWNDDTKDPLCTVYKQRPKTEEQKKLLNGKRPDYVLYQQNTNRPLIIIEAKKPHEDIHKALKQGIDYAKALKVPMVFATDGIYTKTYHLEKNKPLFLNKEEIDELIRQSQALEFIQTNELITLDQKVIKSREELISIFSELNDEFRTAGVRAGLDRIELFCNMLFLKVISELSDQGNSLIAKVPDHCRWYKIKEKKGIELFEFINRTAFDHFKSAYGGDVLSPIPNLMKYDILNTVVDKLDNLYLSATNTDVKGDAFEYFLRNYGGADTDFGEYFTPRHVVKTLTKLLNPQSGEKIYDPFCGTGGMLITAYKHIYERMARTESNIKMLKEQTIYGGELTEMFRVAKMNMILAGDGHSNINRQDSYGNPQRGKYDVVITNIPFGRKMKTDYASLYGYDTKSAEITGILHCLDSLNDNDNARAGIIVPEGILFDKSGTYTQLREMLIEKHNVETVVSLPAGTFAPNTGIKSDIILLKKKKNTDKDHIWYFNVKNDGYTLDTARRKIEGDNDFDIVLSEKELSIKEIKRLEILGFSTLSKDKLKENKYVLIPKIDPMKGLENSKYPLAQLGDIIEFDSGKRPKGGCSQYTEGAISLGGEQIGTDGKLDLSKIPYVPISFYESATRGHAVENDIIMCKDGALTGKCAFIDKLPSAQTMVNEHVYLIRADKTQILQKYLFFCLSTERIYNYIQEISVKGAQPGLNQDDLKSIVVPLPPIDEQHTIIAEIEQERIIIESNKKLIENSKLKIKAKVDSLWDQMKESSL